MFFLILLIRLKSAVPFFFFFLEDCSLAFLTPPPPSFQRFVIEEEKDIKKAMALLTQSECLRIEDILPYFPEFVIINDFKDEICRALEDYNMQISDLKEAMDEATKSADNIRRDIKDLRNRNRFVPAPKRCDLCATPALTRAFYLFPCDHAFHVDCLATDVARTAGPPLSARVPHILAELREDMPMSPKGGGGGAGGDEAAAMSKAEQLRAELDEAVGGECVLCGAAMINSVDAPFISADEREAVESWRL
jgi:vacuolar protein sorting-associated protein 18